MRDVVGTIQVYRPGVNITLLSDSAGSAIGYLENMIEPNDHEI
jgi:hypothetical protein